MFVVLDLCKMYLGPSYFRFAGGNERRVGFGGSKRPPPHPPTGSKYNQTAEIDGGKHT